MVFYHWKQLYPELATFLPAIEDIERELNASSLWQDWPETYLYETGASWKVIPFCATFPGNDASATRWNPHFLQRFPVTVGLLKQIPNLRTAGFSKLGPHTSLDYHHGWADLSNHVLRCHLPITVPKGDVLCGVICETDFQFHKRGEWMVFDDSKRHKAFNHSEDDRVVLIVDLQRPSYIPKGTSDVEMSSELNVFLDAFT
jgi:aspartyl/asparaginyl beta-hydroxylase (cupin superfamily)